MPAIRRILVSVLAAAAVSGPAMLVAAAASEPAARTDAAVTVRPAGVGLPVGTHTTDEPAGGTAAWIAALREYHDSGRYARDLSAVNRSARRFLRRELRRPVRRPAIVLDVDETSLSNWARLSASDFGTKPVPASVAARPAPAIPSTRALYREARRRRVAVFFVTGRSPARRADTLRNLRDAGYDRGWAGAAFRPRRIETIPFKRRARARIERRGYTILLNVGDQESDLVGGHARRAFKLPNPFYVIAGH
ncbi:MAG: HAD family acid phosphatase [Solirubrobacteraceae bacterium]